VKLYENSVSRLVLKMGMYAKLTAVKVVRRISLQLYRASILVFRLVLSAELRLIDISGCLLIEICR